MAWSIFSKKQQDVATTAPSPGSAGAVDLRKKAEERLAVSLEKASDAIAAKGLGGRKARVALALDISGSMGRMFNDGTVQRVCERILALGLNFDDDGAIDVFLFGRNDYEAPQMHRDEFHDFVKTRIVGSFGLEGETKYAGVISRIARKFAEEPGDPGYVAFVTDGDNSDHSLTEEILRTVSGDPVFFQFIGIGGAGFSFLRKLDEMDGRIVDNAGFFEVRDIDSMSDEDLYDKMLSEFPEWIEAAKAKDIL